MIPKTILFHLFCCICFGSVANKTINTMSLFKTTVKQAVKWADQTIKARNDKDNERRYHEN